MIGMYLTWLDSNSWLIEMGGKRVLLDPWLVGSLIFGNLPWLFKGNHPTPQTIPPDIDLILLSQGLPDHAHIPTLEQLDRQIPVVASVNAAKIVNGLGYPNVTTLAHGSCFTLADSLKIQALPGSLVGPNLIENGYLLTDLTDQTTLYYEPHGSHTAALKDIAPVDVVITPLTGLEIPFVGPVIKGLESAIQAVEWLQPQVILPTAAGGNVVFEGLLLSVLRGQGDVNQFRTMLAAQNLTTRVLEPKPGERFEIKLASRVGAT
jgi:L-ascorbate metabolism protein UlaG (beta-lactamase superfamily)